MYVRLMNSRLMTVLGIRMTIKNFQEQDNSTDLNPRLSISNGCREISYIYPETWCESVPGAILYHSAYASATRRV